MSWFMSLAAGRTFVDDHGVEHSTDKSNPLFITRARNALFFFHHGGGTEQVLATCKYFQRLFFSKFGVWKDA